MAGTENPVRRFCEFFRRADSVPTGPDANPLTERSLVIDWQRLAEFDAELAQRLLDEPDAVVGYACKALTTLGATSASVDRLPQLRIRNLDTETPPENLANVPLGHLVLISGILVAATDVRPTFTVLTVECQHCGTSTKGRYFGLTAPDVEPCRSCGREDYMPVTTESNCIDTQYGRLLVTGSVAGAQSESIHIRLDADLQPVTPGMSVTVTGVVRPCQQSELGRQPTLQTRFIDCCDIVSDELPPESTPPSTTWTLNDLAAHPEYLAGLADAIAPSVSGFWRAKLVLALMYAEPAQSDTQAAEKSPNILLVAPQSAHRRRLLEAFSDLSHSGQYQATAAADEGPIVAAINKVASNCWIETGSVVQTAGGLAIVDGLESAAETQQLYLTQALSRPEIKLAKAGIEISLDTCEQIVATATPTTETPADCRDAVSLDDAVFAVFDLTLMDSATVTTEQSELVHAWAESIDTVSESRDVAAARPDTEAYRSVLKQARLLEQPTIGDAARQRLHDSHVERSVLGWVATALARLCGQQRVRSTDVDRAECIATLVTASTP